MLSIITIFFYLWIAINAYPLGESQQYCPDDFVQLHKNCYYFSTTENAKNWTDAEKFCKNLNSKLLSIESSEESAVITNYIVTNKLESIEVWTSGSNKQTEGKFMWTATQTPLTYTNWCKDFPKSGTDFNCITLTWTNIKYRCWANHNTCASLVQFACESTPTRIISKDIVSDNKIVNMTVNFYFDRIIINNSCDKV